MRNRRSAARSAPEARHAPSRRCRRGARRRPARSSSAGRRGARPRAPSRAGPWRAVMSGWRTWGSSVGSASKTISERDSVTSITTSASSSRVNSCGLPMLIGSWTLGLGHRDVAADLVVDVAEAARLAAVAEHGQRLVLQRLAQEGRDRAAVVRAHPRAVGVERPDDPGVDALLAVVGHRQRLGVALGLVVDAAGADRVHVAPVGLGLGVHLRVAVDLRGRGEHEPGPLLLRQAEHVVGAVGARP